MKCLPAQIFEIFSDRPRRWRARRQDGLVEGIFVDRAEAARFARRETMAWNHAMDDRASVAGR